MKKATMKTLKVRHRDGSLVDVNVLQVSTILGVKTFVHNPLSGDKNLYVVSSIAHGLKMSSEFDTSKKAIAHARLQVSGAIKNRGVDGWNAYLSSLEKVN